MLTRHRRFITLATAFGLVWFVRQSWATEQEQFVTAGRLAQKTESLVERKIIPSGAEQPAATKRLSDDRIAVVNGVIIKRSDFEGELERSLRERSILAKPVTPTEISGMRSAILENLIGNELLYQESQRMGITIAEAAIKEKLDALKKQFPSDAEYRDWLAKTNVTEVDLTARIKRDEAIAGLLDQEILQKITITAGEMKAFYDSNRDLFKEPEKVKASYILIKADPELEPSQKAEAHKRIENIQWRLERGADFAELAKETSECSRGAMGGDLGYFRRGQMAKLMGKRFEDATFALSPGEMSDIIESDSGFCIIKVTDKKPEMIVPYDSVNKDMLEQNLRQQKVQKEISAYIEKLEEKATVERYLE